MKTPKKIIARNQRHNKIRAKISGTAERPRLVVFKSLNFNYLQLVNDQSSEILASSTDLKTKKKQTKLESAKAVGTEIANKAKELKIKEVVFDRNGYKYHGRVKALADAAREAGLKF